MAEAAAVKVDIQKEKAATNTSAGGSMMLMVIGGIICVAGGVAAGVAIGFAGKKDSTTTVVPEIVRTQMGAGNVCEGKKPTGVVPHTNLNGGGPGDHDFDNSACIVDGVVAAVEQAGADVTAGYTGDMDVSGRTPITVPYYQAMSDTGAPGLGMCPVNVHWHLGTEHRSEGEYDEDGSGPGDAHRQLAAGSVVRKGMQCHIYDTLTAPQKEEYDWKHCVGMHVGETYEVHWPHSAAGACGTPNQYQTPFYDGVFCSTAAVTAVLDGVLPTYKAIGVQGQVFTIVNDEDYYWPDLMRGMIVDGDFGSDIAAYTGSTTGTTRSNTICSNYAPITWQVDRKCHKISASSFDKMCADMKAQRDDMSDDLYAHGSRELVDSQFVANNHGVVSNGLFRE